MLCQFHVCRKVIQLLYYRLFVVVQLLSHVRLFVTPWTAAFKPSLSFTISQSLLKFISIESVMPSTHLILCRPLLLLPSIFPSIRVFSNEVITRYIVLCATQSVLVSPEFLTVLQVGGAAGGVYVSWNQSGALMWSPGQIYSVTG